MHSKTVCHVSVAWKLIVRSLLNSSTGTGHTLLLSWPKIVADEAAKENSSTKKIERGGNESPDSVRDIFEDSDSDSTVTVDIDTTQEITSDDNIEQLLKDF